MPPLLTRDVNVLVTGSSVEEMYSLCGIKDFEDEIALKVLSWEHYSRCQSGPEVITKVLIRRRQEGWNESRCGDGNRGLRHEMCCCFEDGRNREPSKEHRQPLHVCTFSHFWLFETPWTQLARLLCPWIFQATILESLAISFSRGSSLPGD